MKDIQPPIFSVINLPIENILYRHNFRWHINNREGLLESIRKNGILEPIKVEYVAFNKYRVVDGNHRLECARLCGHTTVPCIIVKTTYTGLLLGKELRRNARTK